MSAILTDDFKAKIRADFEDWSNGEFPDHHDPAADPIMYVCMFIDEDLCRPEDTDLRKEIMCWLIDVELQDEWDIELYDHLHPNDANNREIIH